MKYFTTLILIVSAFLLHATTYEVGPGKTYSSILQISTHNLQAGDSIKVFYKPTPYYEKFLLHGIGTLSNPIVLIGIADANGSKPIIDGNNALSNQNSSYWNEERQVILIGQSGSSVASDYIIIDGFEIRGANNFNTFTDNSGTPNKPYSANGAGIRISWGKNITIKNCDITDNGIGIQSGQEDNMNLLIEYSNVFDNGKCTWNNSLIHNFYLSSGLNSTVTIQYCHIGELLSNGQQLRTRAQTSVIRYNWIEGGRNSSLDLVQAVYSETDVADAYVYGNVILKPENSVNSRIVHFGSDDPNQFRLGTCYFYNNTVIIKDTKTSGTRRIFQLSDNVANIVADNNIIYKPDAVTYELAAGTTNLLTGSDNWFSNNINGISVLTNSLSGTNPDFVDLATENYHLNKTSPCYDVLSTYNYPATHPLNNQYVKHLQSIPRPINGNIDLGAFETGIVLQINENDLSLVKVYPNPTLGNVNIVGLDISQIKLYDMNGKLLKEYQSTTSINISDFPTGIYIMKLMTNNNVVIKKIIKE